MKANLILVMMVFGMCMNSRAQDSSMQEAREAWERAPVHSLTWVGRWVDQHLLPEKKVGTLAASEVTFIKNSPDSVFVIQNSACRALAISYTLCGVEPIPHEIPRAWDEEADAVRHFIFSSFLACSRGKVFAESYTIAHEGSPELWAHSEEMDIHNNYVAFKWATEPAGRCQVPLTDARMAQTALKLLSQKKLMTLKKGDTLCANPELLIQQDWGDFTDRVNALQKKLGQAVSTCKPGFRH
jgi:hypothetical protein